MSYTNNYYNYQIGVIFAILIAGVLLLAICVAAVYFGCVVNMRTDKKRRYTPPNIARAAPPRQWQPEEQPNVVYTNLNASRATPTEYVPTQSPQVPPSAAPAPSSYMQQPLVQSYPQHTLVQPYPQELGVGATTHRQMSPEDVYQQGPTTWHTVTTTTAGDQNVGGAMSTQSSLPVYHTSSV